MIDFAPGPIPEIPDGLADSLRCLFRGPGMGSGAVVPGAGRASDLFRVNAIQGGPGLFSGSIISGPVPAAAFRAW